MVVFLTASLDIYRELHIVFLQPSHAHFLSQIITILFKHHKAFLPLITHHKAPTTSMDYFDDLLQDALDAFSALDTDTEPPVTASGLSSATMDLLRSAQQNQKPAPKVQRKSSGVDYLFKLTSPITPAILASAAILSSQPRIVDGESEDGVAQFCLVDEGDVAKIKRWLTATYPSISPVFCAHE
jgi:hypothetical protein